MCAPRVASNIRSTAAGSMARPSARGSWSSSSRGRRADVEALTERDRCCGCCPWRTVLGLCIFVSRARGRLASLRFSRACVECPRPENVHVWEASARRYASRGRPRGRTGRSSDFARRLTSTRMVSGATWCLAARSRAATAGRHTRNRTSHSKTAPLRGRSTGGATARGRVSMRGAHRRPRAPRAARGYAAEPQRAPGFVSNPDGVQPPSSGPPENPGFNLPIDGQRGSQEPGGVVSPDPGLQGNVHSAPEILKDLRTPFTNCFKKPGADCEKDQVTRMSGETLCHRAQAPSTHTVRSSSDCMGVWRARVEDRLAWVIVFLRPARVPASHRWATPRGGRWVPVA